MRWQPAVLYRPDGDQLRCTLCPYRCSLRDGAIGICNVRRRHENRMETATFATSVVHSQAVERKPLYHYRPGHLAVTLAAPGCTFRCDYCVNFRISQYGRAGGAEWSAEPVSPPEVVATAAEQSACVALSYTEPSLAMELTVALAECGAAHGVEVVWKSNGFLTPEAVDLVAPNLAAVNIDLKGVDEAAHRRITRAPVAPVLSTIRRLREHGVWVEVSTPLIPRLSTTDRQVAEIAAAIAGIDPAIPWHLLRFTPTFRMRDEQPTSPAALATARRIGLAEGLRYVYVERALGPAARATRCPHCGSEVITRDIWALRENRLQDSRCPDCDHALEGRW